MYAIYQKVAGEIRIDGLIQQWYHYYFQLMCSKPPKIESILFVPENLTFSENLRCLNLPLLVGALSQKRSLSLTCFVFAGQNVHSGKFKHLKYSENVKFSGTNSIDSILRNKEINQALWFKNFLLLDKQWTQSAFNDAKTFSKVLVAKTNN